MENEGCYKHVSWGIAKVANLVYGDEHEHRNQMAITNKKGYNQGYWCCHDNSKYKIDISF